MIAIAVFVGFQPMPKIELCGCALLNIGLSLFPCGTGGEGKSEGPISVRVGAIAAPIRISRFQRTFVSDLYRMAK